MTTRERLKEVDKMTILELRQVLSRNLTRSEVEECMESAFSTFGKIGCEDAHSIRADQFEVAAVCLGALGLKSRMKRL